MLGYYIAYGIGLISSAIAFFAVTASPNVPKCDYCKSEVRNGEEAFYIRLGSKTNYTHITCFDAALVDEEAINDSED